MSTIDKKSVIEGRNEDSNSLDLFKDVSTGNLMYRTALGIEVVVATKVGLQDVLDRLAVLEEAILRDKLLDYKKAEAVAVEGK